MAHDISELSVEVEAVTVENLIEAVEELAHVLAHLRPRAVEHDRAAATAERSLQETVPRRGEVSSTPSNALGAEATLDGLAQRALTATGADGIAVALIDRDEMVCRASAGIAPDKGVRWHAASGLTGEALRLRKPVLCEDTESDSRVDPMLCRAANLRCCLIIPVLAAGVLKGTVEAYASRPRAFTRDHAQSLVSIASALAPMV